jgi:hypothetical protein
MSEPPRPPSRFAPFTVVPCYLPPLSSCLYQTDLGVVGTRVTLTDDYRTHSDAGGGPLQLGQTGSVVQVSGTRLQVRPEAGDTSRVWWCVSALLVLLMQLASSPATAGSLFFVCSSSVHFLNGTNHVWALPSPLLLLLCCRYDRPALRAAISVAVTGTALPTGAVAAAVAEVGSGTSFFPNTNRPAPLVSFR